jgi:uncharacterized protein HemX
MPEDGFQFAAPPVTVTIADKAQVFRTAALSTVAVLVVAAAVAAGWTAFTTQGDLARLRQGQAAMQLRIDALSGRTDTLAGQVEGLIGKATALEAHAARADGRLDVVERNLVSMGNAITALQAKTDRICFKSGIGGEIVVPCVAVR